MENNISFESCYYYTSLLIEKGAAQEFFEALVVDPEEMIANTRTFLVSGRDDVPEDIKNDKRPILIVGSLSVSHEVIHSFHNFNHNLKLIGISEDVTSASRLLYFWQLKWLGEMELERRWKKRRRKERRMKEKNPSITVGVNSAGSLDEF